MRSSGSSSSLPLVTVLLAVIGCISSNEKAPHINPHSNLLNMKNEVPYKLHEDVMLNCQADGVPPPEYSWRKNGEPLNLAGPRYSLQPGTGNLIIKVASDVDEGDYNCLASNKLGTAVGLKMRLQKSVADSFPKVSEPTVLTPTVGESLTIPCSPPRSYPKGIIYFGFIRSGNVLENIVNDNRVLLDYEGNLHFANVLMKDSLSELGNVNYLCVLNNAQIGTYVHGSDHKLLPRVIPGSPTYRAPHLMWPMTTSAVAIKGQTKSLKCIFGGLPTPTVTWHGGSGRFNVTPEGYGTEIRFMNIDLEDDGVYECTASNSGTGRTASHRIKLTVQSPPVWNKAPLDLYVDEESDIEVNCQVHGTPQPNSSWSINGNPVHASNFNGRKQLIGGHRLVYRNVTVNDSQVIQCMATNEHGSLLANVILKVNAEQPSFLETPEEKKVVKGTIVHLKCNARGAPKPSVSWTRGTPPRPATGRRFIVHDTGALTIKDTELEDTDIYRCVASNKHGKNDASARVIIRSPTSIKSDPVDKVINASNEVVIPCEVTTDPNEVSNLIVDWYKDGDLIDFKKETHMYMDETDHSLRIRSSKVQDTADYTCNASNGLDSAKSEISRLKVRDRPDPPYDVKVIHCLSQEARISWYVGSDNNDPITEFTIYYNDTHSSRNVTLSRRNGDDFERDSVQEIIVSVRPWSRYTFSVTARNSIGTSQQSGTTEKTHCSTPQVPPYRNPRAVCGKLKGPRQLVITWEPMPEEEHNGEGFHYIVGYKVRYSSDVPRVLKVKDPLLGDLTIYDQQSFTQYEVHVQASNNMGTAPYHYSEKRVIYSGEGKPLEDPKNFRLGENVNGSYADFFWDPVDTSPEKVRGFFRGYQIIFWRTVDPEIVRSEDVLIDRPFKLCEEEDPPPAKRSLDHRRRHKTRSAGPVHGATNKLWPLSRVSAAVRVMNQAQAGPMSNVVEFETPVGVPGKVSDLRVVERGSSHLLVEWQLPVEFSGTILQYRLSYSVAYPSVGQTINVVIPDPFQKTYKIKELDFSTRYQINVAAMTSAGLGEVETVIGETLPEADPDAPKIVSIELNKNSANVSWIPSENQPPINPGSDFYVEYRGPGNSSAWSKVPASNENWVNISDLERGMYEVRVVALSGNSDAVKQTRSKTWTVLIGKDDNGVIEPEPQPEPRILQQATTGWFIILMCIIALLLLILIIICILRRAQGDMYPVYEKEKMWRHNPLAPDETPFGEYTPPSDNPTLTKSQGSLDSDEKPMDSDSDSLGEYEDQDASKFNEDGSFIGQYTGKHKPDASRPSVINTSV